MYQTLGIPGFGLVAALLAAGCGASPATVDGAERRGSAEAKPAGNIVTNAQLPINQRFANLDEYLAWLEKNQGPVDGPWYKRVGPNLYELQTGNLRILGQDGAEKKTFTREELERKFGFRK